MWNGNTQKWRLFDLFMIKLTLYKLYFHGSFWCLLPLFLHGRGGPYFLDDIAEARLVAAALHYVVSPGRHHRIGGAETWRRIWINSSQLITTYIVMVKSRRVTEIGFQNWFCKQLKPNFENEFKPGIF